MSPLILMPEEDGSVRKGKLFVVSIVAVAVILGSKGLVSASTYWLGGATTYFDANKTSSTDDDNMCWAAAASNILAWGGWGSTYGSNEDSIFSYFIDHWTDSGSLAVVAWYWWFTGTDITPNTPKYSNWSNVEVQGGGFYSTYDFLDYFHYDYDVSTLFDSIVQYVDNGWGTTVSVYRRLADGALSGHALTCWGYDYDEAGNILGLWVTDSDDGALGIYYVSVEEGTNGYWYLKDWYGTNSYYIGGVTALAAAVPVPSSLLLFISGLAGLFGMKIRKVRKVKGIQPPG
jgi:hypothetical protein